MNRRAFTTLGHKRRIRLVIAAVSLVFVGFIVYLALDRGADLLRKRAGKANDIVSVEDLWEDGRYSTLTEVAEEHLLTEPMDRDALLFAGYSRYFLAISRMSTEERTNDLNQAIRHLRLLLARGGTPNPERVEYMLGKAYLAKGKYWSDLAVQYLRSALASGYEPADIYEYLGRAYSAMGGVDSALKWYLKALAKSPTDRLLLTIGEQSFKLGRYNDAAEYYRQAIEKSRDDSLKKRGLLQLGQLYYDVGNYEMAKGSPGTARGYGIRK